MEELFIFMLTKIQLRYFFPPLKPEKFNLPFMHLINININKDRILLLFYNLAFTHTWDIIPLSQEVLLKEILT